MKIVNDEIIIFCIIFFCFGKWRLSANYHSHKLSYLDYPRCARWVDEIFLLCLADEFKMCVKLLTIFDETNNSIVFAYFQLRMVFYLCNKIPPPLKPSSSQTEPSTLLSFNIINYSYIFIFPSSKNYFVYKISTWK